MSQTLRVFVNGAPVDVPAGAQAHHAIQAFDAALGARFIEGAALVTDARGIAVEPLAALAAGSILRVVVSARRTASAEEA